MVILEDPLVQGTRDRLLEEAARGGEHHKIMILDIDVYEINEYP